jgi:hypothetical protein
MRCLACGADMILMHVVPDETMPVAGFEHHTFMCSECYDTERRLFFAKPSEPVDPGPIELPPPIELPSAPPIVPTAVESGPPPVSRFLKRMLARLRGP